MMFSRVFGLHPMLVLKEWHQHQLKILLYSLLMSGLYIVGPFLAAALNTRVGMLWQVDLAGLVSTTLDYGSSILFLGWFIAFVWGVLLSDEKKNGTLDFLLTTPVTRRQVVKTKYIMGMALLILNLLVVAFYLAGIVMFISTSYTLVDVGVWFIQTAAVLAAVFGIAFAASTVAGNAISSGILAAGIIFGSGPVLLGIHDLLYGLGLLRFGDGLGLMLYRMAEASGVLGSAIFGGPPAALPSLSASFGLLLLCIGLYYLSVWLFERNPLERNGGILVFGDTRRVIQVIVTVAIALWTAWARAGSVAPVYFLLLVIVISLAAYYLIGLLFGAMRSLE